jgi:hypothetical protein
MQTAAQLQVIRLVNATLGSRSIRWWLFGGWALDAVLGEIMTTSSSGLNARTPTSFWMR